MLEQKDKKHRGDRWTKKECKVLSEQQCCRWKFKQKIDSTLGNEHDARSLRSFPSQKRLLLLLNFSTLKPTVGTISPCRYSSGLKWLRRVDFPELSSPTISTLHSFFFSPNTFANLSNRPMVVSRTSRNLNWSEKELLIYKTVLN